MGFGPVFQTSSKADAAPVSGLVVLRQVALTVGLPVVSIGGIHEGNAGPVLEAGSHGIAVISAVCCQEDPEAATRCLCRVFAENLHV